MNIRILEKRGDFILVYGIRFKRLYFYIVIVRKLL